MLDVLGGDDFLSDATHRLGSRGRVLDRKLGPRYDVSRPIVLTTIQQGVSAGKCVARMISPPRQHNSCSPNVISASAAIAKIFSSCSNALHAFDSGTPVFHVCGTRRKSKLFWCILARPGPLRISVCLDLHAEKERLSRLECGQQRFALGNVFAKSGRCSVSGQKHSHPKGSASRPEFCSSRDHTRPPRWSFALTMLVTMNARRFQITHPLRGTEFSVNLSADIGLGVTDLALACGSEPVVDAGSDREDRSSDVCCVGDTR